MRRPLLLALWTLLLLSRCGPATLPCDAAHADSQIAGNGVCLVMKQFANAPSPAKATVLYVILHGDGSQFGPAVYHYAIAAQLARATPNSVAAALLRPGYEDDTGQTSGGDSNGHHDNYSATNVAIIAGAIRALRTRYPAARVIGVGHSGGAAVLALVGGRFPGVLDGMVLVSCPCDLPEWPGGPGNPWANSLSPQAFASGVPVSMRVRLLTAQGDINTVPSLAKDYAASLAQRGNDARFTRVPHEDHNSVFRSPQVIAAATEIAR